MFKIYRKRCITSENQFDFLKDLVANVPDLPSNEEERDGEPKPKRYSMHHETAYYSYKGQMSDLFSVCTHNWRNIVELET